MPELGLNLAFRVDGLSLIFLFLIAGVGIPLQIFAADYFKGSGKGARYWGPMALFTVSMLGLVFAEDLILLFLFWELTSFSSFLLIGVDRERPSSRYGAQMALIVTAGGGLFLLAGILILQRMAGTFDIGYLLDHAAHFRDDPLLVAAFLCILIGAMTKSAQFPFHFWLPNAMAAPAPVSAYLHSATMVKAGVYLMARFFPVFGSLELWSPLMMTTGGITFLWGAWVSFHKSDMKALLAYTTLSGLGLLFFGLGLGTDQALTATFVFLLAHAFYKAPLFLLAGVVEKKVGHRDLRELSGLVKLMPFVTATAVLAGLAMAGLPPLLGFLAKEEFLGTLWQTSSLGIVVFVAASALIAAAALKMCYLPFFKGSPPAKAPKKVSWIMRVVPLALALVGLLLGIFPSWVSNHLIDPALIAVGATQTASELTLWHGFTPALVLSATVFIFAYVLFRFRTSVHLLGTQHFFEGDRVYEFFLRLSVSLGTVFVRIMQTGSLPYYVLVSVLSLCVLLLGLFAPTMAWPSLLGEFSIPRIMVLSLIAASALMASVCRSLMASILSMGVTGFAVALFFSISGAPDLAMTQFSIECLALLLFVLSLRDLPNYEVFTARPMRTLQIITAGLAGLIFAYVAWMGLEERDESVLSRFFGEHSLSGGHGKNVVNVILVDFRGLDTMGEITVLAIAALGVVVLLGGFHELKRKKPGAKI